MVPRELLVVDRVGKVFSSQRRAPVTVIDDLPFSVNAGSFVCIVGPSGCGKSTLLQLICGLVPPTSGEIRLAGEKVVDPPSKLVVVFQQYAKSLLPWRTVEQNVALSLETIPHLSLDAKRARIREQLTLVGLSTYAKHHPHELSGGMQQRVAIARALARPSEILLMDEPFSALDALTRSDLQELLLKIWREFGKTIVFITHDIDEAAYLSTDIIVLGRNPGRVLAQVVNPIPIDRDPVATRESATFLKLRREIHHHVVRASQPHEKAPHRERAL